MGLPAFNNSCLPSTMFSVVGCIATCVSTPLIFFAIFWSEAVSLQTEQCLVPMYLHHQQLTLLGPAHSSFSSLCNNVQMTFLCPPLPHHQRQHAFGFNPPLWQRCHLHTLTHGGNVQVEKRGGLADEEQEDRQWRCGQARKGRAPSGCRQLSAA